MRKLQPCGTRAAYVRHLRNNEEPCDACRAANVERAVSAPSGNSTSREVLKLEEAMEKDPPRIQWTGGLVKRGIILHDPYADHPNGEGRMTDEQRRARRAELERQRRERLKEFATVLAERQSESPLLAAARTEL